MLQIFASKKAFPLVGFEPMNFGLNANCFTIKGNYEQVTYYNANTVCNAHNVPSFYQPAIVPTSTKDKFNN